MIIKLQVFQPRFFPNIGEFDVGIHEVELTEEQVELVKKHNPTIIKIITKEKIK